MMLSRVAQDEVIHIKKRKILRVLGSCAAQDKTSEMPNWIPDWAVPTRVQDWKMPSWVPDWSIPNPTKDLPYCHSTANGTAEMRYDGGEVLEVTGVALGIVNTLDTILPPDAAHTMPEIVEMMQKLAPSYWRDDLRVRRHYEGRFSTDLLLQHVR